MWMDIRGINHELSEGESRFLHEKIGRALNEFEERVKHVTVRAKDVNASRRGGIDKNVHITVETRDVGTFVLQQTEESIYAAAEKVSVRLQNTLGKKVNKKAHDRKGDRMSLREVPSS